MKRCFFIRSFEISSNDISAKTGQIFKFMSKFKNHFSRLTTLSVTPYPVIPKLQNDSIRTVLKNYFSILVLFCMLNVAIFEYLEVLLIIFK